MFAATFGRGIYWTSTTGLAAAMTVSPLSVDVTLTRGTTVTTGVTLRNVSTTATVGWQLSAVESWISAPVLNGTLGPNASLQLAIRASAADLQAGDYLGHIQLVSGSFAQTILVGARVTAAPANITIAGGDNAIGGAGASLPPFQVMISDARQVPLPGVTVNFVITSGGGFLSARTVTTNEKGVATTVLTLPLTPGTVRVVATSGEVSGVFTATAVPAPSLLTN
ncbi:MAG: hypothetical protein HYU27_08125, partial [Acidobacteria bacterium]|nr:hypothetical protein [Acidobacteriota bacterium]